MYFLKAQIFKQIFREGDTQIPNNRMKRYGYFNGKKERKKG